MEIVRTRNHVENIAPPFPGNNFATWDQFEATFTKYQNDNHLRFRVRSSRKTDKHNAMMETKAKET